MSEVLRQFSVTIVLSININVQLLDEIPYKKPVSYFNNNLYPKKLQAVKLHL